MAPINLVNFIRFSVKSIIGLVEHIALGMAFVIAEGDYTGFMAIVKIVAFGLFFIINSFIQIFTFQAFSIVSLNNLHLFHWD